LERFRDASGKLYFYDLTATRHPSFSVNGFLVHNCSMVDTDLAADLFTACRPGTHVLLVGDTGQLPPVGHGCPLRDLATAGVPSGHLTQIVRNTGRIVKACHDIADGRPFETADRYDPDAGDNLRHIEAPSPSAQVKALRSVLRQMEQSGRFDPREDVQVIVPLNAKSEIGREPLNLWLQDLLNPDGEPTDDRPGAFRVGDRIICLRNHLATAVSTADDPADGIADDPNEVYMANGEVGFVTAASPEFVTADFAEPRRTIAFPLRLPKAGGGFEDNDDFALAYAVTCHKFQGSEKLCVIVMVDDSPGAARVTSKNWWYTAISRAQRLAITIGKKKVMLFQARKKNLEKRKTFLARILLERQTRK
jgi:exodeoxyribonuclease V alpha subunit